MSSEDFEHLKKLLLNPERKELDRLTEELNALNLRLESKDELIEKLKPILLPLFREKVSETPEEIAAALAPAIGRSIRNGVEISRDEIAEALSPIMGDAIKKQVSEAREEVVDALYPVIGQTNRKSIAEAMKKLAQTVNEKVDKALSFQILIQKMKARLTGVPEDQLILKEALPFKIHEIFLIHRESGLLIAHVSDQDKASSADQEIISGMLTAIRDFASTAFSNEIRRELNEIQYDDLQIYLEAGRHAYLAVVTSGIPPKNFLDQLRQLEQQIHQNHHHQLRNFDGNMQNLKTLKNELEHFSTRLNKIPGTQLSISSSKSRPRGLIYLSVFFILVIIILWSALYLPDYIRTRQINSQIEKIRSNPPINLVRDLKWQFKDGQLFLGGMVESRSSKDSVLAFLKSKLKINLIQNDLKILPSSIGLSDILLKLRAQVGSGLKSDLSGIQLILDDDKLIIKGRVSSSREKVIILDAISQISQASKIQSELISPEDMKLWEESAWRDIENTILYFKENQTDITDSNQGILREMAASLKLIDFQQLYIKGNSDSIGEETVNLKISEMRAENVKSYLTSQGIDPNKLEIIARGEQIPIAPNISPAGRAKNRRVSFSFKSKNE
jgi:outer membrane protein OmpA-like peptidoglycan-associated protein